MIVANPLSTEVKTNSQGFFYSEIICYFGFDLRKKITAEFNYLRSKVIHVRSTEAKNLWMVMRMKQLTLFKSNSLIVLSSNAKG